MTRLPSKSGGLGWSLISAASFATSGSFARVFTAAGWSPAAVVVVRCGLAAVLLAIPAVLALRGRVAALRRRARLVIGYGVVVVAGCQVCYFNAVQHMPVGLALLLEYLGIVLIVLWLWWRGQRPRRLMVIGSAIAIVGLWFVIDPSRDAPIDLAGIAWALGAAVGLAMYFVLSANADDELAPAALTCGGMIVGACTIAIIGAIGALPLHAGEARVVLAGHRVSAWVPAVGIAAISTAAPYVAGIRAARALGPKLASFISLTEVVFAVGWAALLLGELPSASQAIGGGIIIAGVALVRADELR